MSIRQAVCALQRGEVIAYPTEAVFGLGCDPFNPSAMATLLNLKQRSAHKGFILIADTFDKLQPFVATIPKEKLDIVLATWPGPYTWVFPANLSAVCESVRGNHTTVAIRVTAHPLARQLCQAFGGPITSTSANLSSEPPLRTAAAVKAYFGDAIHTILAGETGKLAHPTEIRDALTGEILRMACCKIA